MTSRSLGSIQMRSRSLRKVGLPYGTNVANPSMPPDNSTTTSTRPSAAPRFVDARPDGFAAWEDAVVSAVGPDPVSDPGLDPVPEPKPDPVFVFEPVLEPELQPVARAAPPIPTAASKERRVIVGMVPSEGVVSNLFSKLFMRVQTPVW